MSNIDGRILKSTFLSNKKCYGLTSLICRGRLAKAQLLAPLLSQLWRGQVSQAISLLEQYRPQTTNEAKLDELINYLRNRPP
jgi:hypothetical protein